MITSTIKKKILLAFGFIGAPLVGAVAGACAISLLSQENIAFLFAVYALFGWGIGLVATLVIGIPAYRISKRRNLPLPKILGTCAIISAQILVLAIHSGMGSWQSIKAWLANAAFALIASGTTAMLIVKVDKEVN